MNNRINYEDLVLKRTYNKVNDNIAEEFYIPCMSAATSYDRLSGYFGSTIYIIAWNALKDFVHNGGKMRIICSPCLSDDDIKAIKTGELAKKDEILHRALIEEIDSLFASSELEKPSQVLACLIATNVIEIKIAYGEGEGDIKRLFHDKAGIFYQGDNAILFRGSLNETFKGLSDDGNFESIDVFTNWQESNDRERVGDTQSYFEMLWNNKAPKIEITPLPEDIKTRFKDKIAKVHWETLVEEIKVKVDLARYWSADKTFKKLPRKHQIDALDKWVKQGHRGIFEHATGSGKTYTAICAIRKAIEEHKSIIVLVPSTDLLSQWDREIRLVLSDVNLRIILCGDGHNAWDKKGVLEAATQKSDKHNTVVISTMDTAVMPRFIQRIKQGEHLFVVADEVHRMGSLNRRNFFVIDAGYRLGLSATPRRYGDPVGTQAIIEYFGGIIEPPYTLKNAIDDKVLTPYYYRPKIVQLSPSEQHAWNKITDEISIRYARCAQDPSYSVSNDQYMQSLLLKRCRIIKKAEGKVALAKQILEEEYCNGQRWIIYCEDKEQLHDVLTEISTIPNVDAYEYYADMPGDRNATLNYFNDCGGVIVSIKCLDEGVDIPATTHAIILASSQNPREFIQRRGRILRRYTGKYYSWLYDAVVVPYFSDKDDAIRRNDIVATELTRCIQFGMWSKDPSCITQLRIIAVKHSIDDTLLTNNIGLEDE